MLRWFCVALIGCAGSGVSAPREWPAGSRVVGDVCFERETADGWVPAQLTLADGRIPVKQTPIVGAAYFPMDAGRLRLTLCK